MTSKANGRSASIIAAGIWICLSGPLLAAPGAETASAQATNGTATAGRPLALRKYAKHAHRHWKRHASAHKLGKIVGKAHLKAIAETDVAANDDSAVPPVLPENIANANAELPAADTPADTPDSGLVSADQLNDVDRTLSETVASAPPQTTAPAPLMTMAAANTPAVISAPATVTTAASSEDNAWSQTSIIGKIFIAFGGLLTLASAARMFMG